MVDTRGQFVTMLDRTYLMPGLPVQIIWGEDDQIIPVSQTGWGRRADARFAPLSCSEQMSGHVPHDIHPGPLRGDRQELHRLDRTVRLWPRPDACGAADRRWSVRRRPGRMKTSRTLLNPLRLFCFHLQRAGASSPRSALRSPRWTPRMLTPGAAVATTRPGPPGVPTPRKFRPMRSRIEKRDAIRPRLAELGSQPADWVAAAQPRTRWMTRGEGAEARWALSWRLPWLECSRASARPASGCFLSEAGRWRTSLAGWAHHYWWGLIVVVLISASATAAAAALVRRVEPHAEGSGIPRVEAIADGRVKPDRFRILPVKYIGGLLAIGAGLALGREGPSVQMGGTAAVIIASLTRRNSADLRVLVAGGAGAGLATAFNAPIAGGVFVLEELIKRFNLCTTVATLVASASGFAAAHLLVEAQDDFYMAPLADPRLPDAGWVLAIGIVAGVLGVLYKKAVMLRTSPSRRQPLASGGRRRLDGGACWRNRLGSHQTAIAGAGTYAEDALLGYGTLLAVIGIFVGSIRVPGDLLCSAATPGRSFRACDGRRLWSHAVYRLHLAATHLAPHDATQPPPLPRHSSEWRPFSLRRCRHRSPASYSPPK